MSQVPRPIVQARRLATVLLIVTAVLVLAGIIAWIAWASTRPPTLQ
jgi:hypothetical protein